MRGEGDARVAQLFAAAWGRNPQFAAFYRSLEAYRQAFANKADILVLDPSSEFFRYFKAPDGSTK